MGQSVVGRRNRPILTHAGLLVGDGRVLGLEVQVGLQRRRCRRGCVAMRGPMGDEGVIPFVDLCGRSETTVRSGR